MRQDLEPSSRISGLWKSFYPRRHKTTVEKNVPSPQSENDEPPAVILSPQEAFERKRRTPLSRRRLELLEENYPSFVGRLKARSTLAGCSHNPFQDEHSADAVATRIAEKYIEHFTKAVADYGYLPYMGAEINFQVIGNNSNASNLTVKAIKSIYSALSAYTKNKSPLAHESIDRKLATDNVLNGRIYLDTQPEISTPASSPLAMVRRVFDFQRAIYEATWEYADNFNKSAEGLSNKNTIVPCGPAAEALQMHMGQFNIRFATKELPTGQHISVSLIRRTPETNDYAHAKLDNHVFGESNLMSSTSVNPLVTELLKKYLPHDELLAFGHRNKFDRLAALSTESDNSQHNVKSKEDPVTYDPRIIRLDTQRIEIRSFNDGSSNIALSTLAILSVLYATVKTIHMYPDIAEKLDQPPFEIAEQDKQKIRNTMFERIKPSTKIPHDIDEATERFDTKSMTLLMMHEFIEDTIKDPEEKAAMLTEVAEFKSAIHDRAKQICAGSGRSL